MKLFVLLAAMIGNDAAAPPAVDYIRDIKPLLREKCFSCHGPLKQEGDLRLDTVALMKKGGDSGPAIVLERDRFSQSPILVRVHEEDPVLRMPAEGQKLTDRQIESLRGWLQMGAPAPKNEQPERDPRQHWAFQTPRRPDLPIVRNSDWNQNPIDRFIEARREQRGLVPGELADRATLLRRVYLDLIGLPPTAEALRAFLDDSALDAFERVVGELLASSQHGERWARHWMDVWRYSDWYGRRSVPDNLNSYGQIWRWRDWIVRSLNADRGYNRMLVEMLAADEVCPTDEENIVATGFLVRNFYRWNYNQWMRDNVEHTAKAFLGLTINCCHCHDHKYDPLTQLDYFRFRAFFEPLEIRHHRVKGEVDPGPFEKYVYAKSYKPIETGAVAIFDERPDVSTHFYTGGDERNKDPKRPPIPPGAPIALANGFGPIRPVNLPATAWYPGLSETVRVEERAQCERAMIVARTSLSSAARGLAIAGLLESGGRLSDAWRIWRRCWIRTQSAPRSNALLVAVLDWQVAAQRALVAANDLECLRLRIAADDLAHGLAKGDATASTRRAAVAEANCRVEAAKLAVLAAQRDLAIAERSPKDVKKLADAKQRLKAAHTQFDTANKASKQPAKSYTALSPKFPKTSSGRRAALANWMVRPDHPLTARVAVNHIWRWHFGHPLVATTENFGNNGTPPTHPELLDYLARELVDNGWSMKRLHRMIVTSRSYRMRSLAPIPENRRRDPDNLALWQFPLNRMEAEVVRDSILHAAGQLDRTQGGKELPHEKGLESNRRSLYFAHHGESKMQLLETFDAANACDAYRRSMSVAPQQALALINADFVRRQSRALAMSLATKVGTSDPRFVAVAFETVLNRSATDAESRAAVAFLVDQRPRIGDPKSATAALESRSDLIQALFNHNDFVTIR